MIVAKYLSAMWAAVAPAVGNHLWQSTLFALVAALLTLMLRKNQARARYWIWLAASLKFLVPFSFLIGVGNDVIGKYWRSLSSSDGIETGIPFAMDQLSQPFTQPTMSVVRRTVPAAVSQFPSSAVHLLPAIVATVWLCGFLWVICTWCVRWRRMLVAMRQAMPLREGREVSALRRLERAKGIRRRLRIFLSRASLEPGVFGIARPVLVWPEGISARLDDAHVEAILAHELGHVRRRDNLFAVLHMFVEAIFWFHPLVWYLGTRLVEEREVACDEEVLELGNGRQIYAESILKICEFCVSSPLACISGVTGADLKRRIIRIMTDSSAKKLDLSKKLLLSVIGLAAIATPVIFGVAFASPRQSQSQNQIVGDTTTKFEYGVASIKVDKSDRKRIGLNYTPDGMTALNVSLQLLMETAYGVPDFQIAGMPNELTADNYVIDARMDGDVADALKKLSDDRDHARQRMLQALLADRFKLVMHRETRQLPVYLLVVAKSGPKLHESKAGDEVKGPDGLPIGEGNMFQSMNRASTTIKAQAFTMSALAAALCSPLGRPILDKTGLTGKYDLELQFAREDVQVETSAPSIFTAIQELGLKLEAGKGPVEVIVIDHLERPSGN